MKHVVYFGLLCIILFSSHALARGDHSSGSQYRSQSHYVASRHNRHDDRGSRYRSHRSSRSDKHAKYFAGGVILGTLVNEYRHQRSSNYGRDYRQGRGHTYTRQRRDYHHYSSSARRHFSRSRDSYRRDDCGDCYRVEYRSRGSVYVKVPSYKCR